MPTNSGNSFCRIENKYIIPLEKLPLLIEAISDRVEFDKFAKEKGSYQVNSIYFDNVYGDIHHRNIAKPKFKEKLRLRSYGGDKPIYFLEFKDKIFKDVYKRRIYLSKDEVDDFVNKGIFPPKNGDTKHDEFIDELAIFRNRYRGSIIPNTLMQYERVAYMNKPGEDYLRLTVDKNITYRREDFNINKLGGKSLLKEGYGILEIKFIGAMPLFVAKALNDLDLHRQTFSKFGTSFLNEAKEARLL
ncbi:MAG: polyphosphate polymerase domain-containing protein [Bacilli bacterium]|nr:polyphosphate polymerase domain-containing protein [Bacilli bacterium]